MLTQRAATEGGSNFWNGSTGKWAGERLMRALAAGRQLTTAELRTCDTLRKDEWKQLDDALIEEATIRLRVVAAVLGAGLTIPIRNAMGKTVFEYEKVTDMNPADVSMDGVVRTEQDRVEFTLSQMPLPLTHKDFWLNLRTLSASRERGESLDTTQTRTAGRLVAEKTENIFINGSSKKFGGLSIFGLKTHPDRNLTSFKGNVHWGVVTKTGEDMLEDLLTNVASAEGDRMFGPYWIIVPRDAAPQLEKDFKANSDKTTRQRLSEVDGIRQIIVSDQLASDNLLFVQATLDVVAFLDGIPLQTIQWDIEGGMIINFKAFMMGLPLIRSDATGRSGVVHMT